jgi:hypothetical protein
MTAGATARRLWHEGDVYAVLYALPDGRDLAVAWATDGLTPIAVSGRRLEAFDVQGNRLPAGNGAVLGEDPLYLTGRGLRLALPAAR